jgi:uncharacterized membrane protein
MSQKHGKTELEKEFELERLVLFSDAVFAIAITLLVIDIKFPEIPKEQTKNFSQFFGPTISQFVGFGISFFFIGKSWSDHLKLFRLLRKYDQGLINRNLFFLFFIVIFPFTASGISGHVQDHFLLPVFLYVYNISGVAICHFLLCRYMFTQKPGLSAEGEAAEKKYIFMVSKYQAIWFLAMSLAITVVYFVFPGNDTYVVYTLMLLSFFSIYIKIKTRKYKPRKPEA